MPKTKNATVTIDVLEGNPPPAHPLSIGMDGLITKVDGAWRSHRGTSDDEQAEYFAGLKYVTWRAPASITNHTCAFSFDRLKPGTQDDDPEWVCIGHNKYPKHRPKD